MKGAEAGLIIWLLQIFCHSLLSDCSWRESGVVFVSICGKSWLQKRSALPPRPKKKKVKGRFSEYSVTEKVQFHDEQQIGGICRHHLWPITEWWRTFYHSRAVCTHYHTGNQWYTASRVWLFGVGQQKKVKRLIEYAVPLFQDLRRQQSLPVYSVVVLIACGHIYSRTVLKCRFEVAVLTWVFFFCSLCVIWCLLQF